MKCKCKSFFPAFLLIINLGITLNEEVIKAKTFYCIEKLPDAHTDF